MLRRLPSRLAPVIRATSAVPAMRLAQASAARAALSAQVARPAASVFGSRAFASDAKSDTFLPVSEVTERVLNVVKNFEKVDPSKVTPKSHFVNDLGLDSLDTVELVMALEEEFVLTIPDDISEKILTCEDAIKFISQHPQAR